MKRQKFFDSELIARSLRENYSKAELIPRHQHPWAQLVYAESGTLRVNTDVASWVVPITRAIWIPPNTDHWLLMTSNVSMHTLYIKDTDSGWPKHCQALDVSALLREVILHCVAKERMQEKDGSSRRAIAFLCDLVISADTLHVQLPTPNDKRAQLAAELLLSNHLLERSMQEVAAMSGASLRTLQRIFLKETGLRMNEWQQMARMQHAIGLLNDGVTMTQVAHAVGYQSNSAFTYAFKALFGVPPSKYYER